MLGLGLMLTTGGDKACCEPLVALALFMSVGPATAAAALTALEVQTTFKTASVHITWIWPCGREHEHTKTIATVLVLVHLLNLHPSQMCKHTCMDDQHSILLPCYTCTFKAAYKAAPV